MKITITSFLLAASILSSTPSLALPTFTTDLSVIGNNIASDALAVREFLTPDLEKRRGGGGGGGRGSSSGGRSSSSSSSSSSGSSGSKSGSTSSTSNSGGSSSKGSGTTRSYGSGGYYAGGAKVPYTAGATSSRGVNPVLYPATAYAFWPHPWVYPVYAYPWAGGYHYHGRNSTKNGTTSGNETLPVTCLCEQYTTCGCDDNPTNSTYVSSILGNGTGLPTNSSMLSVATVNGTMQAFINGTLENGTTAAGATSAGVMGVKILGGLERYGTVALSAGVAAVALLI